MKELIVRTYKEFTRDRGARLAAALAYYTLFAIAPALLVALAIAGAVLDQAAVNTLVKESLGRLLGETLTTALVDLSNSRSAAMSTQTAWITLLLLLGASALALNQMQAAFNAMWNVDLREGVSFWRVVRARLAQALIALVPAALLVVGVLASSAAAVIASHPQFTRFGDLIQTLGSPLIVLVSSGIAFLVMFRYLPDAQVPWRTALIGAALTAVAWLVGTYLFGLYVGRAAMASAYGAAGSVFVLLIWLNYSVRIMLVGCKVSKVLAEDEDGRIRPRPYAVCVTYQPAEGSVSPESP